MIDTDGDKEYFQLIFAQALGDALNALYWNVARLRLKISGDSYFSFHQLCSDLGLSKQRVTQVVDRSLLLIYLRGRRQIAEGRYRAPCAVLLLHLDTLLGPRNESYLERACLFATSAFSCLSPWFAAHVVSRLHNGGREGREFYERAKMIIRKIIKRNTHDSNRKERISQWQRLTELILWPKVTSVSAAVCQKDCFSVRRVSAGNGNWTGKFCSRKMNREVQFESALERKFYMVLEAADEVLWYQEQPYALPYFVAGRCFEYYPDVLIKLMDGRFVLAEIKPVPLMPLTRNINKCRALFDFCTERGWGMLVTDGREALQELLIKEIDREFESVLIERLSDGPLHEQEFESIAARFPDSAAALPAIVLRLELDYSLEPFVLRKP